MNHNEFINQLEVSGSLRTIDQAVNPDRELAAICRREFLKEGDGQALLFKNIVGSSFSVAANLFGSEKRAAALLHSRSFADFSQKMTRWLNRRSGSATQRFDDLDGIFATAEGGDRWSKSTDLDDLPALKCWPKEGGGYLNLAVTLTYHPETGERNLGIYRAQVLDKDHLALNFAPHSGTGGHFEIAKKYDRPLSVCLMLCHDPALIWTAAAPLPGNCDELQFYRSFFAAQVNLVKATTQDMALPDIADIVIEGEIYPTETVIEGPYGNHTGHYVTRNDCPLVKVTAVRYCPAAIVPQTIAGPPPSENIYLGMANEILIREMVKIDFPQVFDVWMPPETIFHGAAVVAVKHQSVAGHKELIYALWKNSLLRHSRFLLLVDEDTHKRSLSSCWWRLVNGLQAPRIYTQNGQTAIDATGIDVAPLVCEDQETQELMDQRRDEYQLW